MFVIRGKSRQHHCLGTLSTDRQRRRTHPILELESHKIESL